MTERPSESRSPVDVAIIGGGLVGASLAVALAPLGLRVALVESQALQSSGSPSWDERCIGLNAASQRIFDALGVWDAMRDSAAPIVSTHISERGRFGVARFHADEAGLPALGYNTPLRAIGAALAAAVHQRDGIEVLAPARLTAVSITDNDASLSIATGGVERPLRARLLVAADGARSTVRELLGLGAARHDYAQKAIVTAVRPQRSLGGVAYERFLSSGPLALLPKPDDGFGHAASLVWTLPTAAAEVALQLDDAAFMREAADAFGERVGRFLQLGRRSGYPLEQVIGERRAVPRVLFAGNAAQTLHPVAAQGFNLGLRDVALLAELLADTTGPADPGAASLLADYERRRRGDRERVAGFTDALVRGFSNSVPGLQQLRHWGLLALNLPSPAKSAVLRQNLGLAGPVPRLARS